ncbi:hypothetical protein [Rhodococcus wratislaviensis]|uniref:Resuscitation-promoting factor n=1 Tax=Rhodococcus wratislaviensis NBRC 100605 TaxID=1219028 RepID=X0RE78_RHOWR|nr:hypothetical protein [Rhodococcus wratislaviensis]GAF49360.1 hypothetical protein RW1_078_00070 [Rhodococcus wratislaviensis NBRC 100605]
MRIRLGYITPVLAAGVAAVAIAAAPTAAADPIPAQPAVIATAPTPVAGHFDAAYHDGWGDRGGRGWDPAWGWGPGRW